MKQFSNIKALRKADKSTKGDLAWEYANLQAGEMVAVIEDTDYGFYRVVKKAVSYFSGEQQAFDLDTTEQVIYLATK